MTHHIFKSFHFRVGNGTAATLLNQDWKAMQINTYHFSKEKITSRLKTYIMPKGSPLQVEKSTI